MVFQDVLKKLNEMRTHKGDAAEARISLEDKVVYFPSVSFDEFPFEGKIPESGKFHKELDDLDGEEIIITCNSFTDEK